MNVHSDIERRERWKEAKGSKRECSDRDISEAQRSRPAELMYFRDTVIYPDRNVEKSPCLRMQEDEARREGRGAMEKLGDMQMHQTFREMHSTDDSD